MKKIITRTYAVATFITVVAFCIAEVGARSIEALQPHRADPVLGIRPIPGPGTDKYGYRNKTVLVDPKIITIGDSFTYGKSAPIDASWPSVLAKVASTSVYNMAVEGHSPVQYAVLLKQALAGDPNIVIIGFNVSNDFAETFDMVYGNEHWAPLRTNAFAPIQKEPDAALLSTPVRVKRYLVQHSRAFARLGEVTRSLRLFLQRPFASAPYETIVSVYEGGIEVDLKPERLGSMDLSIPKNEEGWRLSQLFLSEMKKMTDEKGVKFIVVLIPATEDVYLEFFRKTGKSVPDGLRAFEAISKRTYQEIFHFCEAEKIRCISPVESLAGDLINGTRIYRQNGDDHTVARGYEVVALFVNEAIRPK